MSKQGAVGAVVNSLTRQLPMEQFVAHVSDVPANRAAAGVDVPVDLNACCFLALLNVVGCVLLESRGNLYKVSRELI